MRILMLTHNAYGRGGFARAFALGRSLAAGGHEVTLMAGSRHPRLKATRRSTQGVVIYEMPGMAPRRVRNGGLSALDLASRTSHVLWRRHDLVHGFDHRPTVSIPALLHRRRHGAPYITDWADLWGFDGIAGERNLLLRVTLGAFDQVWEPWTRKRADGVTAINGYLEERALRLGVPPARVRRLPAGADVQRIRPLPKKPTRRKFGIPEEALIATYTGFAPYDEDLLVRAFLELAWREPRARLLLLGGALSGVDRIVDRAGLADRVIRPGFRPYSEYAELLTCGDVMLLPYTNRGVNLGRSPNRMGDYLASGRPTVTNPTGDLGRMVEQEGVGLVADENPRAFADAVLTLFGDKDMRDEMGRKARLLAETRLDWRVLGSELESFYREFVPL